MSARARGCWIGPVSPAEGPVFLAYRLDIELEAPAEWRLEVSADQRYVLFLDGAEVSRGPERGDRRLWFCDAVTLTPGAGRHRLIAVTWALPLAMGVAPRAQVGLAPGFLMRAAGAWEQRLSTGFAPWTVAPIPGVRPLGGFLHGASALAGSLFAFDGATFPAALEQGEGLEWLPARAGPAARSVVSNEGWGSDEGRLLKPAALPPRLVRPMPNGRLRHLDAPATRDTETVPVERSRHLAAEAAGWEAWLVGAGEVRLAPGERRRAIVDLEDYACAYSRLEVEGGPGGFVRVGWGESLFEQFAYDGVKGHRGEIEGKRFLGRHDTLDVSGTGLQRLEPFWWNCGRYIEVVAEAGPSPLILKRIQLRETRLPLEREDVLEVGVPGWAAMERLMWRTLQMCAHETYMDCPYYEQLCYAGDTRLQMLVTYVAQRDARLPAKTLRLFASSLESDGLTASAWPANGRQVIPQFSLFWVAMLHDHLWWRGDEDLVRSLLPNARRVMDTFLAGLGPDGVLRTPDGWNWVDWSNAWRRPGHTGPDSGHPDLDPSGLSGINALQFVYVAGLASAVERCVGDARVAERYAEARVKAFEAAQRVFWDEGRGLFADTPSRTSYSQHAQAYAILTGLLPLERAERVARGMAEDTDLAPGTVYFQHYVFEAYRFVGRGDRILGGLGLWRDLVDRGFVTSIERPDPSRSDCHAWGAHPIYHLHASVLGVRPAAPGFRRVRVAPLASGLPRMAGRMPHPGGGVVAVELQCDRNGVVSGTVDLPEGVGGEFESGGSVQELRPGRNDVGCGGAAPRS